MIKKLNIKIILLLCLLSILFNTIGFAQENDEKDTQNKSLSLIYVDGVILSRNIGEEIYSQVPIGSKLGYDKEITLYDGTSCNLRYDDDEIELSGPLVMRVKDLIEAQGRIANLNLNNANVNRLSDLFIDTNNELSKINISSTPIEIEQTEKYKKIIEIKEKSYFERAFTIAYDYITKSRKTDYRNRQKPDLYEFYYILSEISFQTLNYNIAEASMYKTLKETEDKVIVNNEAHRDITRQRIYLLASLIHTMKSEYHLSVEYLEECVENFSNNEYFKERLGSLIYYMLAVNNILLNYDKKTIENYYKNAEKLCNQSIEDNINNLRLYLKQTRTQEIQSQIDKYIAYLDEASLLLGYIKILAEEIKALSN